MQSVSSSSYLYGLYPSMDAFAIGIWERLMSVCNRDVDNILSKKFKPSSSHILEIYFEKKLGFTSTFGQTC